MQVPDSERLSFALMGPEDAELLFELDQDVEVMRYINGGTMTSRQDVDDVFLPRLAKYTRADKGWGMWKVIRRDDQSFIGWVLVRPMQFFSDAPEYDNLELGWRFKRAAWGQGFATEAARAIQTALTGLGEVRRFSAIAMPGNAASIGIMKKLGMQYQKTGIHKDPLGEDEVVYYSCEV
jgi:RimJ/RimL family protein N-acetyltransferase